MLGASGVQLGTAFLTVRGAGPRQRTRRRCARPGMMRRESRASSLDARAGCTPNEIVEALEGSKALLPFPAQHYATSPLRGAAAKQGDTRLMALWAGRGRPLSATCPPRTWFERWLAEAEAVISSALR